MLPVALAALAQAPQDPAQSRPNVNEPVAGVLMILNDDALTIDRVSRAMAELRKRRQVSTAEDLRRLQMDAQRAAVSERLQTQAGEDMGIADVDVERRAKFFLKRRREQAGLLGMADLYREQGLDSAGARENDKETAYRASYYFSNIGSWPGVRGRPWRDTYVRPGELGFAYEQSAPAMVEPDTVVLQVLDVPSAAWQSSEAAHDKVAECRKLVLEGAPFEKFVKEFGSSSRATKGVLDATRVDQLRDEELRQFAHLAEPNQLSEVLPWRQGDRQVGWRIVRMLERRAGTPAPEFSDPLLQSRFRKQMEDRRQSHWLSNEEARLFQDAWRWPQKTEPKAP